MSNAISFDKIRQFLENPTAILGLIINRKSIPIYDEKTLTLKQLIHSSLSSKKMFIKTVYRPILFINVMKCLKPKNDRVYLGNLRVPI